MWRWMGFKSYIPSLDIWYKPCFSLPAYNLLLCTRTVVGYYTQSLREKLQILAGFFFSSLSDGILLHAWPWGTGGKSTGNHTFVTSLTKSPESSSHKKRERYESPMEGLSGWHFARTNCRSISKCPDANDRKLAIDFVSCSFMFISNHERFLIFVVT